MGGDYRLPRFDRLNNISLSDTAFLTRGIFSLAKSFDIAERKTLQFRAEVFNEPNHPNFAVASQRTAFTSATGVPSPTAGIISSTTTRPRQI